MPHQSKGRDVEAIRINAGPGFALKLMIVREKTRGLSRIALLKMCYRS